MIVKIITKGLLVVPETGFEEDYIQGLGFGSLKCFVKHGLTPAEVIGVQIEPGEEKLGNIGIGEEDPDEGARHGYGR
jgi:hypothetical protein